MFAWVFEIQFEIYRSSRPEVFCKKVLLEILQNSQENTCARVSTEQLLWLLQDITKINYFLYTTDS